MEVSVTSKSYCVEITLEQFLSILVLDKEHKANDACDLGEVIEFFGARDVEYNGHFGAAIFFSLNEDWTTEQTLQTILNMIQLYINAAMKRTLVK